MIPVLCDEWYLIKYDDHDMAKAVILTEEASNAVVDKVRALGKEDGSSLKKLRKDKLSSSYVLTLDNCKTYEYIFKS